MRWSSRHCAHVVVGGAAPVTAADFIKNGDAEALIWPMIGVATAAFHAGGSGFSGLTTGQVHDGARKRIHSLASASPRKPQM